MEEFKMKKKIVSIALACALFAVAVAGGTLAYFTANDKAKNDFTVGNAAIDIEEPAWEAALQNGETENMYPGQTVAKDPQVLNTGNNPVFIRVKVENPTGVKVTYNNISANWTLYGDYYYYNKPVDAREKTDALFTSFTLSTETENGVVDAQSITVKADAVQSQGFTGDVANVAELDVWFRTCLN